MRVARPRRRPLAKQGERLMPGFAGLSVLGRCVPIPLACAPGCATFDIQTWAGSLSRIRPPQSNSMTRHEATAGISTSTNRVRTRWSSGPGCCFHTKTWPVPRKLRSPNHGDDFRTLLLDCRALPLHRARHMDAKASSTRDSAKWDDSAVRSEDLRAVGISVRWGPEGRLPTDARFFVHIARDFCM